MLGNLSFEKLSSTVKPCVILMCYHYMHIGIHWTEFGQKLFFRFRIIELRHIRGWNYLYKIENKSCTKRVFYIYIYIWRTKLSRPESVYDLFSSPKPSLGLLAGVSQSYFIPYTLLSSLTSLNIIPSLNSNRQCSLSEIN